MRNLNTWIFVYVSCLNGIKVTYVVTADELVLLGCLNSNRSGNSTELKHNSDDIEEREVYYRRTFELSYSPVYTKFPK